MMSSDPIVGDKRSALDAPDTSDDDGSQPERGKEAEAAGPKLGQAERQTNKKLRRDGEARSLSREERKMTAIMRQIEEMEKKEKVVKPGPCFTHLEVSVGRRNEKVGEKRRSRDACDAGGEGTGQGLREVGGGAGGEKLENKRKKEAKHMQGSFQGKGKEEAVEKRKRPSSEEANEAQEQQHEEEVGGSRASGEVEKKKSAKCPHNRQRSQCWQSEGSSTCEHRRILRLCKQCNGLGICEHNRIRSQCKQCDGASICEHNRQRSKCKQCGGASICEHNRIRSKCKQCGGESICEHNRIRSGCK
jgi:hypothetical protein